MEYYAGQLKDFKFNTKKTYSSKKDEDGHRIKRVKCYDIFTFDIEVTSAFMDDKGKVMPYEKGYPAEYWNNMQKFALCYIWQFSVNDKVYYGRELEEFINLLNDLPEAQCIIYVHNLSYEFCFLLNVLTVKSVFARTPQHPMKCIYNEFPLYEFRCSLVLAGLSLDAWGKELGVLKKTGQLDYIKLRTPYTELTKEELEYCEYDCLVVYAGILDLIKEYGNVFKLPLTSTGRVRREFKRRLVKDKNYIRRVKRRIPSVPEYELLQEVYAGGYTHPNRLYSNQVQTGLIEHYDFSSSYPYCLMLPYYPTSRFFYDYHKNIPTDEELHKKCWILDIELYNLKPKTFHSYIQASKCEVTNPIYDNGRISAADYCAFKCTEFDWFIIRQLYDFSHVIVRNRYSAKKGYLHRNIIDYVLELYEGKTKYKNVEGKEDIYLLSKKYVNSCYGMFVTAPISADICFDGENWFAVPITRKDVEEKFNKLKDFRDSQTAYFLDYSTGVWCTAIARYNLFTCILGANNDDSLGQNCLYSDTDSCFILGKSDYSWYNNQVIQNLKDMCDHYDIPYERCWPKDPKGKERPLGIFTKEDDCKEFISCHAKCYCERRFDDKLYMTISGINKSAVKQLNNDIYKFKDGMEFDKDDDTSKKNLHTYIHNMGKVIYPDGYVSEYAHGIHMMPTGYKISVTDEYDKFNKFTREFYELPEHSIIRLRALFK